MVPPAFYAADTACITRLPQGWGPYAPAWSGLGSRQAWLQEVLPKGQRFSFYLPEVMAQEITRLNAHYGIAAVPTPIQEQNRLNDTYCKPPRSAALSGLLYWGQLRHRPRVL
ncbi:hypothetical protein SAMN00120144_4223 [Hymenobacter roseosalivarius DSM 11622]|uniref:Uncharacterized protein n=1 Tax=Hymenobacter roseosalivarius DSM 11622 TaxID=645990 RepID=A0A1W1UFI5_9BACT|nr:hypothetical protein [Hymenobacter roseosalivarius]SMB79793.1 hypothetical protein SAMN00120144_4223 [Hymenobacter roseosalivarius DSM 11622]